MSKEKKFFNYSNWVFWVTLGMIVILSFPHFKDIFFNEKAVDNWLLGFEKSKIDSIKLNNKTKNLNDIRVIKWNWKDYKNNQYSIKFNVNISDILSANEYRKKYGTFFSEKSLYMDFIEASQDPLDSMLVAMQNDLRDKKISGIDVLNYVVSAIQTPAYTLINGPSRYNTEQCPCSKFGIEWLNDCSPRPDGKGCCNNVAPFGVFTPAEFIAKKTGDCDTKSLIAYALLKKLGFDAALIVGNVKSSQGFSKHAMLAIANVRPVIQTKYLSYDGFVYYPWEVTGFNRYNQLGNMSMWDSWEDWEVICN